MRNTFTIYSPHTDLRGKKVLLRCDQVVEIPADAITYTWMVGCAIIYTWRSRVASQNVRREGNSRTPNDIMKVVK